MKQANIYSSLMTLTMARKIMELQELGVPFEVSIVNGIGIDEKLAKLEWDQTALDKAYEDLEKKIWNGNIHVNKPWSENSRAYIFFSLNVSEEMLSDSETALKGLRWPEQIRKIFCLYNSNYAKQERRTKV